MRSLLLVALLIGAGALGVAGPAFGAAPANLVSNGTFDTTVTPWTGASWNAADAGGSPGSGSARVVNTNAGDQDNAHHAEQCIDDIVPGKEYRLSGDVLIPAGQSRLRGVGVGTRGYAGPGCTGASVPGGLGSFTHTPGAWESLESVSTFSQGALSATIYLEVSKWKPTAGENPSDPVSAMFDNIVFVPVSGAGPFRLVLPGVAKN